MATIKKKIKNLLWRLSNYFTALFFGLLHWHTYNTPTKADKKLNKVAKGLEKEIKHHKRMMESLNKIAKKDPEERSEENGKKG